MYYDFFIWPWNIGGGGMIVQAIPHLKYFLGGICPHPPGIDTHGDNHI